MCQCRYRNNIEKKKKGTISDPLVSIFFFFFLVIKLLEVFQVNPQALIMC